jgi:hypothetical protein
MRLLLPFLVAVPLLAQVQVFTPQGDPLGPSVNLGSAAARDSTDFRFRAVNTGAESVALQTIAVNGAGFSLGSPFLPVTLGAGQAYEFSIRFSPTGEGSYSAGLTVNSFTSLLRATAVPGPSLFLTLGEQTTELTASSLQVNVAVGQTLVVAFSAGNPNPAPIVLNEISITGSGFAVDAQVAPVTIRPGETVPIRVRITAGAEGETSGLLVIGPRRFSIIASVFRPQLAPPQIVLGNVLPRNGQQLKIRLLLDQPALGPGTGTLRATFTGASDDAAIVFPNGTREVPFDVAAGSREATFDGAVETVLQTGTTVGTLRLDAITETGATTWTYRFDRGPVVVDEVVGRRNGSNLEIDITGFDNTREVGSLNFRFFDRAGAPLSGVITATPGDQFRTYFAQSNLGGVFKMRAVFPVTGDATIVGSVLIEIANQVGRTDLQRLNFP